MPSTPRISVNDLALFMLSSHTAQIGIVKRAKSPQTPPIIRYKDARGPITAYLTDPNRNLNPLITAETMFQNRAADLARLVLKRSRLSTFEENSPRNRKSFTLWNRIPRK